MIKEAIDRILQLEEPLTVDVDGRTYATKKLIPAEPPDGEPVHTATLDGLLEFLTFGEFALGDVFAHVVSETQVILRTHPGDVWKKRGLLGSCTFMEPDIRFGLSEPVENFLVGLRTKFAPTEDSAKLLQIFGNVKGSVGREVTDDGVSQFVTTRTGVATLGEAKVPSVVMLKPFSTFHEVGQTERPLIVRLKGDGVDPYNDDSSNISITLYEADGGAWKLPTVLRIKAYLAGKNPELRVLA